MNIEIANKLQQIRNKNNLSQEELAAKIGVSRQAVSKWERAESSPDTENLILLSRLYGISIDELLRTDVAPEAVSSGVSLRKDDYGYTDKSVREIHPQTYTEEEIYPNNMINSSIPQGTPFGADIADENKHDSSTQENFGQALERAGRAIGDVINVAGQKIGESMKKSSDDIRRTHGSSVSSDLEKKFECKMSALEQKMENFGEKVDQKLNKAFAEKKDNNVHSNAKFKKKNNPATLLDKLFPLLITFLFFCTIPLDLAHPGWTLFLLIPIYYTTKHAIRKRSIIAFCYPLFCTFVYFFIGGFLDVIFRYSDVSRYWYEFMWLIFLTIPLFYTAIPAIRKRNPLIFCYPVLCVIVYVGVGMLLRWIWSSNLWFATMWMPIFMTIPIYYIVISHYRKKNNQ